MKLEAFLVFSVYFSLLGLFSQSEGANVWSRNAQVTAIQGESATLAWNVTLTGSDVSNAWVYVKILHAEGANTEELVTFKKKGGKTIDNPSYNRRLSDMTFNVSQSGSVVTIRFTMANLVRSTDMKSYKAVLGFSSDASTYPLLTTLTILVKPHSTEFKTKPSKKTFCLGDKVNFTCKADGFPPAEVSLLLNNQLLQSDNTSVTLTLSLNVKGENNFICVPNNTAGIGQTRTIKLDVKEPPKIVRCWINDEEVTNKSVKEDTKVTMSCQVTGSEPLSITWYKENIQASLPQSNTLTFDSIRQRDSGQYTLTVNGKECEKPVTKILHVTVMCPPRNINGTFILTDEIWKEDLKTPSSDAFFVLRTKINKALKFVYEIEEFVTAWRVLGFVKGSVAVNFQLDVIANVTDPIILLRNAVDEHGGKLNGLAISRNSIKKGYSSTTKDAETAGKTTESDDETGTYVGIGVAIFLLLVLVIVLFVCWYKRRVKKTFGGHEMMNEISDIEMNSSNDRPSASLQDKEITPNDRPPASPQEDQLLITPPRADVNADTGNTRRKPHCKKCGEPMKGHKKGQCRNHLQDSTV